MLTQSVRRKFQEYPVIAAVRTPEDFEKALDSKVRILAMVGGDVFKAKPQILKAKKKGCLVFFHIDLVEGIGKDASGIHFAKEEFGIDGVQSTRTHILKLARHERLITIHRLFVNDFQGLKSGMTLVESSNPDFVELTPGIIPRIIRKVTNEQQRPVIASGLVATENDVKVLLEAGASNIVCSSQNLWTL